MSVFGIHMEDRDVLTPGKLGRETRRVQLGRNGGEPDQIIHDHVHCAAYAEARNFGVVEGLGKYALPRESSVTMHQQGKKLAAATRARTFLLGAHASDGNRVHTFQ